MNASRLRRRILIADLAWAAVALAAAYPLRYGINEPVHPLWRHLSAFGVEYAAAAVLWIVLHDQLKLDSFRGGWNLPAIVSRISLGVMSLMAILLSCCCNWIGPPSPST